MHDPNIIAQLNHLFGRKLMVITIHYYSAMQWYNIMSLILRYLAVVMVSTIRWVECIV